MTQLRYLNFSGFEIIGRDGYRVVIDPFLSGSAAHGIPPSPVSIETLDQTDLVLVSHGAFDHLGQSVEIVQRSGVLLGCGPDVRLHALAQGVPEERIAYTLSGCTVDFGGVAVKALDVRHISLFQSEGRWLSGQPLSFMLKFPGGPTIYHSGDTSLFSDLRLFGDLHRPDVALLCVGGVRSHGFEVVPLPPDEAALALEWLGARLAIPMHYRPVTALFEATLEAFGRLDILVNNAGLVHGPVAIRHFLEMPEAMWHRLMAVNLNGLFYCSQRAAQIMVKQGQGGCIINMSSGGATRAHRQMVGYDTTKGGIEAATRAMALDLAPWQVRVNAIVPGAIAVDSCTPIGRESAIQPRDVIPLARLGTPEDVAGAAVYLASAEAAYVTGHILFVDGGLTVQLRSPAVDAWPDPDLLNRI